MNETIKEKQKDRAVGIGGHGGGGGGGEGGVGGPPQ